MRQFLSRFFAERRELTTFMTAAFVQKSGDDGENSPHVPPSAPDHNRPGRAVSTLRD
jgi:hypothetical protein